jgi:hypothetical protein
MSLIAKLILIMFQDLLAIHVFYQKLAGESESSAPALLKDRSCGTGSMMAAGEL